MIVGVYALLTKERFKHSCLRLRMPGVVSIVYAVLLPSTAEHAIILFLFGDGGGDIGFAIVGATFLVICPILLHCFLGYLVSQGRVILHTMKKKDQKNGENGEQTQTQATNDNNNNNNNDEDVVPSAIAVPSSINAPTTNPAAPATNEDDDLTEFEEDDFFRRRCPSFSKSRAFKLMSWLGEPEFEYLDNPKWPGAAKKNIENNNDENDLDQSLLVLPSDTEMVSIQQNEREIRQRQREEQELRELLHGDDQDDDGASSSANSNQHHQTFGGPRHRPNTAVAIAEGNEGAILDFLIENPFFSKFGSIFEDFNLWYFSIVDISVSAILGISSGIASGTTSRLLCMILFFVNIGACLFHFYLLVKKRCMTPRFAFGYSTLGSAVTLAATVLSFIAYLGAAFNQTDSFSALGLTQAALGICAAVAAFVGIINFIFQMGDAYFISKKRKNNNRKGMKNSVKDNRAAGSAPQGSERNVVFEFDFLADLDNEINNNANVNRNDAANNNNDDDDFFANLDEELRNLAAASVAEPENKNIKTEAINLPDLNHLLDDVDNFGAGASTTVTTATALKRGPNGEYLLDDDQDEGARVSDELKRAIETGGRNAELERRQEELAKFLRGEKVE